MGFINNTSYILNAVLTKKGIENYEEVCQLYVCYFASQITMILLFCVENHYVFSIWCLNSISVCYVVSNIT